MGKRKRRLDKNKNPAPVPLPDLVSHSSQMDSPSKEKSTRPVGTSSIKPQSSTMEIADTSSSQNSPTRHNQQHHNNSHDNHNNNNNHNHNHQNSLSRALLLKHPRNYYGRQYSRRNSSANQVASDASTCHRKGPTPLRDEKLSFKLSTATSQSHSTSRRPERIRSSLSEIEAASPQEMVKIKCAICQKLLKTKTYIHENIISSSDVSVVAVLVCGHVFHADCLETRTCHVNRRDPPCPLCVVDPPS